MAQLRMTAEPVAPFHRPHPWVGRVRLEGRCAVCGRAAGHAVHFPLLWSWLSGWG